MNQLNVLSMFSGCGGLDYGFDRHPKFQICKSIDSMKHAVDTYNHKNNFSTKADLLDVTELLKPEYVLGFQPDVIIGGPPCQDFSVAGKLELGARASLTETFVAIVCKHKPTYFVMENVPTIRTVGKLIYEKIIAALKEVGYGLSVNVVYMPDYGVPQERKRLVVLGVLNGEADAFDELLDAAKDPVDSIREYIAKHGDIGMQGKEHIYRHPRTYERRGVYSIDMLYPTVRGCLRKMSPTYEFHKDDSSKQREAIVNPDWLLVAKIQTFPDSYEWLNKNNAVIVGNAVPVKFSEVLARIIALHSE